MKSAARCLAVLLLAVATGALAQNKILHVTFQAAETGFDPVRVHDYYSGHVLEAVYDTLLTYDYLARPAKVVPSAAAMPEISADGKTYTFRIKKGIYFTDDPAFTGKKRELTAQDFAYSIRRFFDPKNRSPYAFLFTGKIVGLDHVGPVHAGRAAGIRIVHQDNLRDVSSQLADVERSRMAA
jgi:ABC-type oligopeptide transport system substrate-binding subunit